MAYVPHKSNAHIQPGPQNPQKYGGKTGKNYQHYGELDRYGLTYDPVSDRYYRTPKEKPGLADQIKPIATAAGTTAAMQSLAKGQLPFGLGADGGGLIGKGATAIGNAFGLGGSGAAEAATGFSFTNPAGAADAFVNSALGAEAPVEAGVLSGLGEIGGTMGLGGTAALGAGAAAYGAGMYNYGGKEVLEGKAQTEDWIDLGLQSNPITAWINPLVDVAGLGSVGEIASDIGIGHKSTGEYQAERWGAVAEDNPGWADFYQKGKESAKEDPNHGTWTEETDPTGRHVGEKWNFEAAKDIAKEHPTTFIGTYAHAEAFGDKWLSVPQEKQEEFVQKALDEGLYSSDKGSILFSGKKGHLDRARELFNEVMGIEEDIVEDELEIEDPVEIEDEVGIPSERNISSV